MADKKITELDAVVTPVNTDVLPTVQNVSTTPVTKKITWTVIKAFLKTYFDTLYPSGSGTSTGTNTGDATTTTEGALINGATNKSTPVDADYIGLMDSAASNVLKKLSWANLKATLKTYFDTLYIAASPAFAQNIAPDANESLASAEFCSGSNSDGSALFFRVQGGGSLYRFARDANSGQYIQTHKITPTLSIPAGDTGALVVIGSYLYMLSNDGVNVVISRFLAADLTGEQVMTVPTLACTNQLGAWTDGTYLWVVSQASDTTSHKWSVSGTTFTDTGVTGTVTTNIFERDNSASMYDGIYPYYANLPGNGTIVIQKITTVDGSVRTQTIKTIPLNSDTVIGCFLVPIDTLRCYLGFMYSIYDETAQIASGIVLYPISKP